MRGRKYKLTAEVGGVRMTLKEISERTGASYSRIYKWYRKGRDISEMLDIRNGLRPNPRRYSDIRGQRFGRLTAIEPVGTHLTPGVGSMSWRCVCDCGRETVTTVNNLKNGLTRSCGCLRSQNSREIARRCFSRPRLYFDIDGESMSVKDISERFGIAVRTIRGWCSEGRDIPEMVGRYVRRRERRNMRTAPSYPKLSGTIWTRR